MSPHHCQTKYENPNRLERRKQSYFEKGLRIIVEEDATLGLGVCLPPGEREPLPKGRTGEDVTSL